MPSFCISGYERHLPDNSIKTLMFGIPDMCNWFHRLESHWKRALTYIENQRCDIDKFLLHKEKNYLCCSVDFRCKSVLAFNGFRSIVDYYPRHYPEHYSGCCPFCSYGHSWKCQEYAVIYVWDSKYLQLTPLLFYWPTNRIPCITNDDVR